MDRRDFIKIAGAATAGGTVLEVMLQARAQDGSTRGKPVKGPPPNIIVILVDEMRYPKVFPAGITTANEFIKKVMPETYKGIWNDGVKFSNYFTASDACSPARGTIVSGLYNQQSWVMCTRPPQSIEAPSLNRAYPTYGKLLRQLGYETPYIGKWHLSDYPTDDKLKPSYLEAYGFDGLTIPDPLGQGTEGFEKDQDTAAQAVDWLSSRKASQPPFCLTVGFINPHDKEFFWGGTEWDRYNALYEQAGQEPYIPYTPNPAESSPPSLGFPAVPPNWESAAKLKTTKPGYQTLQQDLFTITFGSGISDNSKQTKFSLAPSEIPVFAAQGIDAAFAPYSYWSRGLDLYAQVMKYVDQQIGQVLKAIPQDIRDNTIVILTSDHGEYAGAHGLQGKAGAVYDEALRVPLVVRDFSERFTNFPEVTRTQLASSVDFLNLLLGLGSLGTTRWMTPELKKIYGKRLNLIPLLRSDSASGRPYILHSTDEHIPRILSGPNAKGHIIGLRTKEYKLGVYADWAPATTRIVQKSIELEYYDYATRGGRLEIDNLCSPEDETCKASGTQAAQKLQLLLNNLISNELRAPLPGALKKAQEFSRDRYLLYVSALDTIRNNTDPRLRNILLGTFI